MDLFYGVLLIFLLAAELCVIVQLKREKKKIGYRTAVAGFGLVILLTLAVLIFDLRLSYLLIVLAAVSMFLDSYAGYYLDYYIKSKVLDRWLHCYNTFSLALLLYNIIILLTDEGGSRIFRALFILFLGIALGAVHEIMEFIADIRQNSRMQKGLKDTKPRYPFQHHRLGARRRGGVFDRNINARAF